MEEKRKIKFEDYDIEFSEEDFDNMSIEELKECKKMIEEMKEELKK